MILVLGGTIDAVPICNHLIDLKCEVLLSNLTKDLNLGQLNSRVEVRSGALDDHLLKDLIISKKIKTIIDATHPYAEKIKELVFQVTCELDISLIRFERGKTDFSGYDIHFAPTHEVASEMASLFGGTAFLSIGSRNLVFYNKISVVARILDSEKSILDALHAGISRSALLPLRGPFSIEQNVEQFKEFHISVLVTKDSGEKGNIYEKLEAAKSLGIPTVVIQRPQCLPYKQVIYHYNQLSEVIQ